MWNIGFLTLPPNLDKITWSPQDYEMTNYDHLLPSKKKYNFNYRTRPWPPKQEKATSSTATFIHLAKLYPLFSYLLVWGCGKVTIVWPDPSFPQIAWSPAPTLRVPWGRTTTSPTARCPTRRRCRRRWRRCGQRRRRWWRRRRCWRWRAQSPVGLVEFGI